MCEVWKEVKMMFETQDIEKQLHKRHGLQSIRPAYE